MAELVEDGERVVPRPACPRAVSGSEVGVGERAQAGGLLGAVAQTATDVDGLPVAVDGLPVVAEVVLDVREAVPGGRLARRSLSFCWRCSARPQWTRAFE